MINKIISLLMSGMLAGSGVSAVIQPNSESVDVIVEISTSDSDSILHYAEFISEQFPNTDYGYIYDTLLCGFQLTLPNTLLPMLYRFDFVNDVHVCGEYEMLETEEVSMNAAALVGYDAAEAAGLTGDGIVVAVIDSGFDITHPAFDTNSVTQTLTAEKTAELFTSHRLSASRTDIDAADTYINSKMPFVYDYSGRDTDVSCAQSHGTHVAGIIGAVATNSESMHGIAPGCQLLLMKVFDDSGKNASDYAIIAALEDAVRLGADVINLSLGRYCGSANKQQILGMDALIKRAKEAGCAIVCAAGNESTATERSQLAEKAEITLPFTDYTDYGTLSYPASNDYSIAVGSIDNTIVYGKYFRLSSDDKKAFYYTDTNIDSGVLDVGFAEYFDGKKLEFIAIPGIGEESDYENINVSGKLALVSRGTTTFVEKANIAAEHGAVGVIIYNNIEDEAISLELTDAKIPAIAISLEDGNLLIEAKEKHLIFKSEFTSTENSETGGLVSSFSSLGPTPSLTLKPDICAVGGNVYSALYGGSYGGLSGTSMAAPQLTGIYALLCEQLGNSVDKTERPELIRRILMNTAITVKQADGVEYSPRFQGAGLANIDAAINRELDIVYSFTNKPKAELNDLIGDTMYIDVKLTNLTDSPLRLELGVTLTNDGSSIKEIDDTEYIFSSLNAVPDSHSAIRSSDNEANLNRYAEDHTPLTLTLEAGESRIIPITVSLNKDYTAELNEIFPNGHFAEGYVICETESGSYSMPYMGYVGDWSAAQILDSSVYGDVPCSFNGSALVTKVGGRYIVAGINNYNDKVIYENGYIAFSPNGDGVADELYLRADFLRNATSGMLQVTDIDGNIVYTSKISGNYFTKTAGYDEPMQLLLRWTGSDKNNRKYILPDGNYTLTYSFTLDYLEDMTQSFSFDVKLDTEKPTLEVIDYDPSTGILKLTASDDHRLQYIKVSAGNDESTHKEVYICKDISEDGMYAAEFDLDGFDGEYIYVELVDYAYNTFTEKVTLSELISIKPAA
ncbi:MAG: S8 family serine peptidase [Clostridiales bacterium]|nr:S8 family serine peptidase [Clostridiales bacterium]